MTVVKGGGKDNEVIRRSFKGTRNTGSGNGF